MEQRSSEATVHLATDSGLLAILVPSGLQHRKRDFSWWTRQDDLLAEANAGHVVPIETGQGGGYAVRVTFDEPGRREQDLSAQSAEFWLHVDKDEEIAIVTGEDLSFFDLDSATTIWVTPGPYHVTVTRLRWTEEPDDVAEDVLPDYLVYLRPLGRDEVPPLLDYIPDLSSDPL